MGVTQPVVRALSAALEMLSIKAQIYSYDEDFDFLWELSAATPPSTNQLPRLPPSPKDTIVIIWGGWPDDVQVPGFNVRAYLTPLDWAIAYTLDFVRRTKGDAKNNVCEWPPFKIFILDLASDQVPVAPALAFYESFAAAIPWIRKGSPANLTSELRALQSAGKKGQGKISYATIQRYWQTSLAQTAGEGDHHALANLVGPLMFSQVHKSRVGTALLRMLEWIDLLGVAQSTEPSSDVPDEEEILDEAPADDLETLLQEAARLDRPLNVLLLDDFSFGYGWGQAICSVLGATYREERLKDSQIRKIGSLKNLNLFAIESPYAFLQEIGLLTDQEAFNPDAQLDLRFGLSVKGFALDVLLLDLRLFQMATRSAEQALYKELLEVAKKLNKRKILPWPAIPANTLRESRKWVKKPSPETSQHWQALTLLPRILALLDFSLPIVLFSSTGKRSIVKHLSPYGNIITDLEKPRLDTLEQQELRLQSLFKVLCRAVRMARVRAFLRDLYATETPFSAEHHTFGHIEIYIDESRKPELNEFKVVGLMVAYPTERVADEVNKRMYSSRLRGYPGVAYGDLLNSDNLLPSGKDIDPENRRNVAYVTPEMRRKWISVTANLPAEISKILQDNRCTLIPFAFYRPLGANESGKGELHKELVALCDPNGIDHSYSMLIDAALESLIFEIAPQLLREKGTLAIFVATRRRFFSAIQDHRDKFKLEAKIWGDCYERWGIAGKIYCRYRSDKYRDSWPVISEGKFTLDGLSIDDEQEIFYESMRADSVYPYLERLFKKRSRSKVRPNQVRRGLGITLDSRKKPMHPAFRHMHYLADILGHCLDISRDDEVTFQFFNDALAPVENGSIGCIGERFGDNLVALLTAGFLVEAGNTSDLVMALAGLYAIPRPFKNALDAAIRGKAARKLESFTGSDFLRLIDILGVIDTSTFSQQALIIASHESCHGKLGFLPVKGVAYQVRVEECVQKMAHYTGIYIVRIIGENATIKVYRTKPWRQGSREYIKFRFDAKGTPEKLKDAYRVVSENADI